MKYKNVLWLLSLIIILSSCKKEDDSPKSVYPIFLNEELVNGQDHLSLDLNNDSIDDVRLRSYQTYATQGGGICVVDIEIINDNWSVNTTIAIDSICWDSVEYGNDSTFIYTIENCVNNSTLIQVDTTPITKLTQFEQLSSFAFHSNEDSIVVIHYHDYRGPPWEAPWTTFYDISIGEFKNGVTSGYLLFTNKEPNLAPEIYGLYVITSGPEYCNKLYVEEIVKL